MSSIIDRAKTDNHVHRTWYLVRKNLDNQSLSKTFPSGDTFV